MGSVLKFEDELDVAVALWMRKNATKAFRAFPVTYRFFVKFDIPLEIE